MDDAEARVDPPPAPECHVVDANPSLEPLLESAGLVTVRFCSRSVAPLALLATLFMARPVAAQQWAPALLGARVRAALPLGDAASAGEAFATNLGAGHSPNVLMRTTLALGGGTRGLSGTFGASASLGRVLTGGSAATEGLVLRGGVDLFVDALGPSRVTLFSFPQLELGYARYRDSGVVDVALTAGPVWLSRLRHAEALQRFPVAAQIGSRLLLHYKDLGVRGDTGVLPLSTAPGRAAVWSRAMLCYSPSWLAACAEGFGARIGSREGAARSFGYLGLSAGFNWVGPWESDELP